jgi:Fe-S cluster biogenesis protein NfuA
MLIHTEETPNPDTVKFIPGQQVLGDGAMEFNNMEEAQKSPLAARLLDLDGVSGVFLGSDFISVRKGDINWDSLKPAVLGAIMEHFMSGAPVIEGGSDTEDDGREYTGDDAKTVSIIKELLETHVRPVVARDGGDISFHSYEAGVVFLQMRGACSGCPSATATLRNGVENMLKHFLPEIKAVEAVR